MTASAHSDKTLESLRKLWLVLVVIGLVVAFNVFEATQGSDVTLSLKAVLGFEFEKEIAEPVAALWGVIYGALTVGFASIVLATHARGSVGPWAERYPFRIFDLPMAQGIGRGAQALALVVLTLLPAYVMWHSWRVLSDHALFCVEAAGSWVPVGGLGLFDAATDPVRLGGLVGGACQGMTDYWLPWESWLLLLALICASGLLLWSLVELFRPRPPADAAEAASG